ncbi:MAG: hypothetical protein DMF88_12660 [Acidobacteria bacterium]|nr:MAG: hypothetical protein DMF88_12660 [Acidobacteriota bacterium]
MPTVMRSRRSSWRRPRTARSRSRPTAGSATRRWRATRAPTASPTRRTTGRTTPASRRSR